MIALASLATALIVLGAGCAALVSHLNFGLVSSPRKHLKSIPVSQSVCPYVTLMHVAANQFQAVSPTRDLGPYANATPAQWPSLRARIAHRLDVLDHAVMISRGAAFPKSIKRRLAVADAKIRSGEVQVVLAPNASDLFWRSLNLLSDGQVSFGEASDLVGDACGVQLAADT